MEQKHFIIIQTFNHFPLRRGDFGPLCNGLAHMTLTHVEQVRILQGQQYNLLIMLKRYQYWSRDGIVWTDWFKWDGEKMPSPFKKLKVEYKDED